MAEMVLDGSATAGFFFTDEYTPQHGKLLEDVLSDKVTLIQPQLWRYECMNMIRTAVRRGRMTPALANKAMHHWSKIPATYAGPEFQMSRILDLSLQHGLSAYDAAYLSLAESLGAPLYALDSDLLRLKPVFGWIVSMQEYPLG